MVERLSADDESVEGGRTTSGSFCVGYFCCFAVFNCLANPERISAEIQIIGPFDVSPSLAKSDLTENLWVSQTGKDAAFGNDGLEIGDDDSTVAVSQFQEEIR